MKTIIMIVLMSIAAYAQSGGVNVGWGAIWSDSLYHGYIDTTGTDSWSVDGDSSKILDLRFRYYWVSIIATDTGTTATDTVTINLGSEMFNESGAVVDTIWTTLVPLRDYSWTLVNSMIGNNTTKEYLIMTPTIQFIKLTMTNAHFSNGRRWNFIVRAK